MKNLLKKIIIFDKDKNSKEIMAAELIAGRGLPGDRHYEDDKNQITILFDNPNEKKLDGLCTKRFKANLTVNINSDFNAVLRDEIHINEAALDLTGEKGCYDECPLHSKGEKCHLVGNAFFATVKQGGNIQVGDMVK